MKTKNINHFSFVKVCIFIITSFCAADTPDNEMLKNGSFSMQIQGHYNSVYINASKFSRPYTSVDFDLELLDEEVVRVRIVQVDIDPNIIESMYGETSKERFDAEMLEGMSFTLLRKNNNWNLSGPEHADLPFGNEVVIESIIKRAFPLIFPLIPDNFVPRKGFKWSIDSTKKNMSFSSEAIINDFKIADVYELPELHQVAVINGEQIFSRTSEKLSIYVNRMIYIQYDVNSKMAVNAFERYSLRRKVTTGVQPNSMSMLMINVLRIPTYP